MPGILIAASDGSGVRRLDAGMAAYEPSFRPPDGREILFVGVDGRSMGIYAVDVATKDVRTIVEPSEIYGVAGPNWSPDGSMIAFWQWSGASGGIDARTHIIRADGTGDRELPFPDAAVWNAGSEWSNDGTRMAILRGYTDGYEDVRLIVGSTDGSSAGREIPIIGTLNADCCATFEWSPDDRSLLVTPSGVGGVPLPQVIVDVARGSSRPAPWGSTSDPTWQRLAPSR
jgi:Tol biopolymer transport system component